MKMKMKMGNRSKEDTVCYVREVVDWIWQRLRYVGLGVKSGI